MCVCVCVRACGVCVCLSPSPPHLPSPRPSPPSRYLAVETRRGKALDPVCHFHSANGASLWRLNWLADTSPAGLQRSYGFMANYDYDLPAMARHSASYQMTGSVGVSDSLKEYL